MSKEQFLRNVHSAYRRMEKAARREPIGVAHGQTSAPKRTADWLSPQAVADFNPDDFADLSPERRGELIGAVTAFGELDPYANGAADDAGRQALSQIAGILREHVRAEWLDAVERLYDEIARWAEAREWGTKRDVTELADSFLGTYEAPVLLVHTPQGRLQLSPVARFVTGGTGLVDLSVMPSFEYVRLVRDEQGWTVFEDEGERPPAPLTEAAFADVVERLLRKP